ncbi:MAG: protein kinase [Labilithrix sp.]|nr:protein kinase [Labilithrix sp.]
MSESRGGDHSGHGQRAHDDATKSETVVDGSTPATDRPAPASDAPIVAGYDLVRVLGRGGMGVVWEAIEARLDRAVALKVHRSSAPEAGEPADALWTEALVAARIGDPSIVRVLDVGYTLDARPYYAMELVHGTELGALLADGALPPRKAVDIAADMARAAAAAHRHGVVHRDLKPRNVIIDGTGRARVCDFGIAYDARRGDDPYAGLLAGSPPYMAPEQVLGRPIGPQTDIWAIGVMLYEMLTGERPFVGATVDELLAAIGADEPPPPSTRREGLHADLDAVVGRCLTKAVEGRFPSAGALFETLSAISEGRSIEIAAPSARSYAPKLSGSIPAASSKPRRDGASKRLAWSWRLRSSPDALWPYVADTDRFNEAVGLAPVTFTDEPQPGGGVKRTGELRVLGLHVTWREYPFEWVRGREHSVFRWYGTGPLAALWNKVTLAPLADGGTELRHDVWLTPRGVLGQVAAFIELDRKLGPAVDRFYRRLDELLRAGGNVDPFEAPYVPTPEQRALVEAGCARLHAEGFDPSLVEKLAMHLSASPDGAMKTLRPYELADAWGCERAETLDAFVHAAHAGILEPVWDVVCPRCMIAHESLDELGELTTHGRCSACATSFERDLSESVELVFAPHPSVRSIERRTFCAGSPAKRPHVIAQQVLEPGEARSVTMRLPRGTYRIAGAVGKTPWEVVASAVGFVERCDVASDGERVEGRPAILKAGAVTFALHNASAAEETFRVEVAGARDDAVSGAAALTHPSFRAFFSDQLLARGEHLRVRHLAFLFVELVSREALFDAVGDGAACAELARLDAMIVEAARSHEGEVVPSSLAIFVVGFATTLRAVRAALALQRRVVETGFGPPIAIAVHDGRCIALTRAGKPEFFGETLHRGEALLRDCPAGGIALSPSVMADRAAAVAVHESGLSVAVDRTQDGPYAGRRVTRLSP